MKTKNNLWFIKHFIFVVTAVIVCVVLIWKLFGQTAHVANAEKGVLDLRDASIEQMEPIQLIGEWKFYWKKWVSQANREQIEHESSLFVFVPDTWTKYSLHENALPQHGYATYQLSILVNEQDVGKIVSLYIPSVATAYRLWADDKLIASNGEVAASREHMVPKNYAKVATFQIKQPIVELFLQVSNYHQRKAGLWEPIAFGTAEQINKLRDRNVLFQSFVIGCIFMIGIYQLMLFIHRPKERVSLYIATACFCISLRTSLLKDALLVHLLPILNWEWTVSVEYLCGLIALLFFLYYVDQEFALQLPKRLKQWLVILLLFYCLFIIFFPARVYTNTFTFLQIFVSFIVFLIVASTIKGYRQQRVGSSLNLFALILLSAAIINDLLHYRQWIFTDEFISLGLLFYILTQSIHVARKFSHSFGQTERLSKELQQLNESLEKKIAARTEQLETMYRRLQKIEDSRRKLLSSVSHELKTPLTFIQGYIKAMMDGVVSRSKHRRMVL